MRSPRLDMHKLPLFVWAVFITAFLLLLSLPVLAGKLEILPAWNLAECWKPYLLIDRQSAGNLWGLNSIGILRDSTPKPSH